MAEAEAVRTTDREGGPTRVAPSARRTKLESTHGGAIRTLAVTADGLAACSVDELGGMRLWPALDGSLEPRVVDLPRPKSLVLGADPRGFVIGALDDAGGVGVAVVDRDGIVLQRAVLAGDPPYVALAASAHGLVAVRADHQLQLLASDGSIAARIATAPGERVRELAVSGARAVVSIDAGPRSFVRTLALPQLAWGPVVADSDTTLGDGTELALAPSGRRLSFVHRAAQQVVVLDVASGHVLAHTPFAGTTAALVDDAQVALVHAGQVRFLPLARAGSGAPARRPSTPARPAPAPTRLVAGGGRVVAPAGADLAITAPGQPPQYLGYGLPVFVSAVAPGGLVVGHARTFVQLDAALAASPLELGISPLHALVDLRWLGATDWLLQTARNSDSVMSLALVDSATQRTTVVRRDMTIAHVLAYAPTTRLATVSLGDRPQVLRYDPVRRRVDSIATLPKPQDHERTSIVPVTPALAGGVHLVTVRNGRELELRWVRDPKTPEVGASISVRGSLRAVTASGDVYVVQRDAAGARFELAIYRDGKQVTALGAPGHEVLVPDPTGARVLRIEPHGVTLVDRAHQPLWSKRVHGVAKALWLDDGSLALVSPHGVARLDPATGDVHVARCGWRFGLSRSPRQLSRPHESLCTQLR